MNPMTNVKNIKKLSEQELRRNSKTSWHDQYKNSAWIFVGGLPYDLTEGDVICVFSQFGEVVNLNLVRDKDTGKTKGFCFLCYEDQRSTILAVDNFNGTKLLGRTLRVDHVQDYKAPKDSEKKDAETRRLLEEGCALTVPIASADVKKEKHDNDDCVIIESTPSIAELGKNRSAKEIKSETKDKKRKKKEKKSYKDKDKKDKDSDKKKKKRTKRKSRSSSSSDDSSSSSESSSSSSSTDSSSFESDSSEEKVHSKKRKHRVSKKKKSRRPEEESRESEMSASIKRRKLEEKIKALEKALNNVRSGRNKQE